MANTDPIKVWMANDIADIKMMVDRISLGKEAGSAVSAIHWLMPVLRLQIRSTTHR